MQNEKWQIEVKGKIYECQFAELEKWIADRALMPEDKVRRGTRGWIPAGRVPALQDFFEARDTPKSYAGVANAATVPFSPSETFVQSPEAVETLEQNDFQAETSTSPLPPHPPRTKRNFTSPPPEGFCHFHPEEAAAYVCRECNQSFCKACPKSYGTVRICPSCGELCRPFADYQTKLNQAAKRDRALNEGFGFEDFKRAWSYPLQFWQSLVLGALFIALLSFGGFFGRLLANAILFGCIAQTINHIAQGDSDKSFMPDFDNFSVWDDVFRPFFLSIGISLVSFLPLIIITIALVSYTANSLASQVAISGDPQTAVITETGDLAPNPQTGNGIEKNDILDPSALVAVIYKSAALFILPMIISALWAIFYWPMALMIAGYTKSFLSTINPLVGIDTMRRMGGAYVAAFFFYLLVQIINVIFSLTVLSVTSPFEMPFVGNLPATLIIGISSFYFSLVVAFILGSALYKNSDRLGIEIS